MSNAQHPLTWFQQQVDRTIYRNNRPFPITNESDAQYCHTLQSRGFKFSEGPEKPFRLHIASMDCAACEG